MPKKRSRQQLPVLPIAFMVAGLILLIAAVVFSQSQPRAAATPTSAASNIPHSEVPRVSLADAKAAYDLGSAIFVDVRGEPYYTNGHIQGALSINEANLDAGVAELDSEAWIITYCT